MDQFTLYELSALDRFEMEQYETECAERDRQLADAQRNALARQFVAAQHRRFDGTTWGEL